MSKALKLSLKLSSKKLYSDIKLLIEQSRQNVAVAVNAAISILYWNIGTRIRQDILGDNRAEYGKETIIDLSRKLEQDYGKGWDEKTLRHCIKFAEIFSDNRIVSTLWRQLTWSHIKMLMYITEPLKREFYIQMAINEKWSVRILGDRIQSMLYERTAISKKPHKTILTDLKALKEEKTMSPDLVFRETQLLLSC